jgi:alpha-L-fucosidase
MNDKPVPSVRQREFQDWEFGLFCHFGVRTFCEGHRDWDGKPMSATAFNPVELDCTQWVATAKVAGAKYMVLVCKHHDGFANWPSAYTNFSVAQSPWRGGKGDVVRDFTDACRESSLKVGLYYSPAEWPPRQGGKDYDDYFINQVAELLTGYGEVDMLWFDGCGSEDHQYDWPRIVGEIRRMQPNILLFNMGDPDYRWVGNEAGLAPVPCWNAVDAVDFSVRTEGKETVGKLKWLPVECDCRIRDYSWFYEDADVHTVKSPAELLGLYYYSVGRGGNLLLNIGPDRKGLLPEPDASNLLAFGAEVKRRFSAPVVDFTGFQQNDLVWRSDFKEPILIDHVVIREDLSAGEAVARFRIEIQSYAGGKPILVWEGQTIGHKAICHFPLVKAKGVIVTILEANGPAKLSDIRIFNSHT